MVEGAIYYAKFQDIYIIKLIGEVRYQLGYSFDEFLRQLFAREDFSEIIIDLSETRIIDSTCLGLLAKIANYIHRRFGRKVTIFSKSDDINQTLASVGFDSIFNICHADSATTGDANQIITSEADRSQLLKTLYEAHLILSELNDKNRKMFKNVVEELQDKVPF